MLLQSLFSLPLILCVTSAADGSASGLLAGILELLRAVLELLGCPRFHHLDQLLQYRLARHDVRAV